MAGPVKLGGGSLVAQTDWLTNFNFDKRKALERQKLPRIIVEKWHFKNYCQGKMHSKVLCKFCQQPTVTKKFRRSLFCQFCQLFKYFTCKLTKLKTNMRIPQDVLRSQYAV